MPARQIRGEGLGDGWAHGNEEGDSVLRDRRYGDGDEYGNGTPGGGHGDGMYNYGGDGNGMPNDGVRRPILSSENSVEALLLVMQRLEE